MTSTRRDVLKGVAAAGLIGLGGKTAFAQSGTFNYKVATNVQTTHPIYIRLAEAVKKIDAATDGKVKLTLFPNGQLGSDMDMLSQLRSGGIEFLTMPGVILANLVPLASLNSVGFAFPDYPTVWKAMDGPLGEYLRAAISRSGLVVMDKVWDNGFRHITSNKPIATATDMSGLKIRVPVSPVLLSIFKSLGAAPTPINYNELYAALQTKVVDAQENPLPIIAAAKFAEVQKNCSLTGHVWDGYWMLSNKRTFAALPANLRDIVAREFDTAALLQRTDSEKAAVTLQADLGALGMTFNKPSTDGFRKALQQAGFYADWKAKFGNEAWAKLEGAVGKLA